MKCYNDSKNWKRHTPPAIELLKDFCLVANQTNDMDLAHKTLYLLHDDDSYEIVINPQMGKILEIWRYKSNQTCKPEFCRLEWLDEIIQDRIYDRLARLVDDGQISP